MWHAAEAYQSDSMTIGFSLEKEKEKAISLIRADSLCEWQKPSHYKQKLDAGPVQTNAMNLKAFFSNVVVTTVANQWRLSIHSECVCFSPTHNKNILFKSCYNGSQIKTTWCWKAPTLLRVYNITYCTPTNFWTCHGHCAFLSRWPLLPGFSGCCHLGSSEILHHPRCWHLSEKEVTRNILQCSSEFIMVLSGTMRNHCCTQKVNNKGTENFTCSTLKNYQIS